MILTVTMNPSIDMAYTLDTLAIDTVNRTADVRKTAGGKGLNVSRVLHLMKHDLTATGVLGGYFGQYIEAQLDRDGIGHSFTHIDQESRNSIAILHDGGDQTEILEAGPTLSEADADAFMAHFDDLLDQTTLVTISGSLPGGLASDFYAKMVAHAKAKHVDVLLDSSGASLKAGLDAPDKPLLIKPNEDELGALLNTTVDKHDLTALRQHLSDAVFDGVAWIVVSLGAAGAFVKHLDRFYQVTIPKINVVNPVGSGDSTLAGLALALDNHASDDVVMKTAMTTGMLNTMEAETGFVNPALFDTYFNQVTVKEV
ncbi:hexose kinase [Lacticaseibacillus saniviri]|uniref:Tagatose-6-phosphate kinase n=1 Tax=Lacticaseibacillus saniviri JCM 17471 = DSM 24301 TaxID=1293598 RepID=A0A0R2MTC0_9LACO|nr:hexose kinase [Lacticaseibacillus saniviri]KRO15586.1 tagatose-6-phosphate kinase [Lacticaseibacillus saniviri JCM 17471 = DSM 24301]MCG4280957.1 hexose kinase [Lacticaseibacillus saniviri]